MASELVIRLAEEGDAAAINAVYNPFILESVATFEEETYTTEARAAVLRQQLLDPRTPMFVAFDGDSRAPLGFAGAAAFDPRPGYRRSVKVSVFTTPAAKGRGVGRGLYGALFEGLEKTDVHRAYGLVVAPNPSSVRLHEAFGFAHVATLNEVGEKFGQTLDVMWFEKRF